VALTNDGRPVVVTTNHVVASSNIAFRWLLPGKPSIGSGGRGVLELSGADLYGSFAADPGELFQVEATCINLNKGTTVHGGLQDGSSFGVQSTSELMPWLVNANVRSYGAASSGWRSGVVRMMFPRRPDAPVTGLCLIQETSSLRSSDGDSGSYWVAEAEDGLVGVGIHWGFVWSSAGSPLYTFVTELEAALPFLDIATLIGDATWSTTT
jgi:hypothetical protein